LSCLLVIPTFAYSFAVDPVGDLRDAVKSGTRLARRGDLAGAEAVLRKASSEYPGSVEVKTELAYVLIKEHRIRDGYDLVFPIVTADPKNAHAFAVLGTAFLQAGRFHDAQLLFKNAILLNRKEHLAWAGYGMVDFYENRIDDALANLDEAVYRGPDEPDYLFCLAQASVRAEKYTDAAEEYRRFLEISGSMDKDRRARIKGLVEFLDYLGRTSALYVLSGQDHTTVPFELVGDRPVVKVRINGRKEELKFVLDTGSGISVMSGETAKRLHINALARGGSARGVGGDGKFEIVYGMLQQVDIGDVSLKNVPVYLRPFQKGVEADGYIGLSLISKFITTIDYGDNTLALTRKDADRLEFASNDELALPLRLTSSGFLSGEVNVQGVDTPLNFIVDTGASISVISSVIARTDALTPFAHDEKLRVVGSAGIADNVSTFRLPKVTFGKNTRQDVLAIALDLDVINEASGFEQAGILGGNFLKNYRLTFDFRNAKVIFVPLAPEKH
jgi:predicted aspartyl protease/thioredoxin-like negative regulator of GroEL